MSSSMPDFEDIAPAPTALSSDEFDEDFQNVDQARSEQSSLISEELNDNSRNVDETRSKSFVTYIEKMIYCTL